MPNLNNERYDDSRHNGNHERFESYLKQFRPVSPDPILAQRLAPAWRRSFALPAWLAAAAVLAVGAILLSVRTTRIEIVKTARTEQYSPLEPLTMRSANAWLAAAPSFEAAIDGLTFRSFENPALQGKQSAVAVLSKEKIRL